MTAGVTLNIRRTIILLLILSGSILSVSGQRKFTGNISTAGITGKTGTVKYPSTRVTSMGPDWVRVSSVANLNVGDTVMVIQMQGVGISTDQGFYGSAINITLGSPGRWEFHIIKQVTGATKQIDFLSNFTESFDPAGSVQIVKVPSCNSGVVTGTLEVDGWDPAKRSGGVMAIIATKNFKLSGNISLTGMGFSGGRDTVGDGVCSANTAPYDKDSYVISENKAGIKGEGLAIHDEFSALLKPNHYRGQGPNYTGGGGGNARYTGGGGGANRGIGGIGGEESQSVCIAYQHDGGYGGYQINNAFAAQRIFFGGGGGGSTSVAGLSSVTGDGNGGGIVFIITDTLIGGGGNIYAAGNKGYNGNLTGGAGGGGAGGSIILAVKNYSGSGVQYAVRGGNGGDNTGRDFGAGGGGGGGLLWVLNDIPGKDSYNAGPGLAGDYFGTAATNGNTGEKRVGSLDPNLKGFLFNSVWSTGSGLRRDTVCSDQRIPKLTGTNPIGGIAPYSYQWEKSYNNGTTWVPSVATASYDVTIAEPAGTILFRRKVTDNSAPVITDISIPDTIVVQPAITGNGINITPDIICRNQVPAAVVPSGVLVVPVPGDITYKWARWSDGVVNDTVFISNNNPGYTPTESLTKNTYYRRIVESGRCVDRSAKKLVTVLPLITGNSITSAAEEKCFGTPFSALAATMPAALSGGDGSYTYTWVSSTTGTGGWTPASGTNNNGASYDPDETTFNPAPKNNWFRRVVYSGAGSVCKDTSAAVKLTMFPLISNNTISPDVTICKNTNGPVRDAVLAIGGGAGAGTYTYFWEQSTNSGATWNPAPGVNNSPTGQYNPGLMAGPAWYRRVAYSGVILPATCSSTSAPTKINMYQSPTGTIVTTTDTASCSGTPVRLKLTMTGKAPFTVDFKDNVNVPVIQRSGILASDTVLFRLSSAAANTVYTFQFNSITDGNGCKDSLLTGQRKATVYKYPVANSGPRDSVCGPLYPALKAVPSTYTGMWWKNIPAEVTLSNPTQPNSQVSVNPGQLTGWRRSFTLTWHEENGLAACSSEKDVTITFAAVPTPVDAGLLDTVKIYTFDYVDTLRAVTPLIGTGIWEKADPPGEDPDIISGGKAVVYDLREGINKLYWIVSNGICVRRDSQFYSVKGLIMPKGFSPNGDLVNDSLIVVGLLTDPASTSAELTIINSAGSVVYKTSNLNGNIWVNWDGKNSSGVEVPDGTYYYLIRVNTNRTAGKTAPPPKSGFVIVKRSYN